MRLNETSCNEISVISCHCRGVLTGGSRSERNEGEFTDRRVSERYKSTQ